MAPFVDRRLVKKDLLSALKDLGETARALDPADHPGLAAEMRLGRTSGNYGALLVRARAIHSALVPVKAAFVEYGSPCDGRCRSLGVDHRVRGRLPA
jgi:hypothetical protein